MKVWPSLLLLACTGAFAQSSLAPAVDLPADDPGIEVLRRIQTSSGKVLPGQAFPQTQTSLQAYLATARVSAADSAALLFAFEGARSALFSWDDSARMHALSVRPEVQLRWSSSTMPDSNDASRLVGLGGSLYGRLGPYLSFFSHALAFTEYTDKAQFTHQFDPEQGETYSVEKGAGDSLLRDRTYNRFESYVLASLGPVILKAGRDRVRMGPGYFSSLLADANTPPYWLLEVRVDFAPWLSVDDYLLRMVDTRQDIDKYANVHRMEFHPFRALSLGFQDIVIYQDRGPDWGYALPLFPLTFAEADNGGRDNAAMAFDFLFAGLPGVSCWGELFIDDLLGVDAFFDNFWENRWAGLTGFQLASPFPAFDADLVVEYSHVEPWTYNGRKPQTSFKHFNVPSGSLLGPDSRTWDIRLAYRPTRWMELKEGLSFYDKDLGRSGTLGVIHDDSIDGLTKEFLAGPVRSDRFWIHEALFRFRGRASIAMTWNYGFGDTSRNQASARADLSW